MVDGDRTEGLFAVLSHKDKSDGEGRFPCIAGELSRPVTFVLAVCC